MRAFEILNEDNKTDYLNDGKNPIVNGLTLQLARIKNPSYDTGYAGVIPEGGENYLAVMTLDSLKNLIKIRSQLTSARTLGQENPQKQIETLIGMLKKKWLNKYREIASKVLSTLSDRELEKLWAQTKPPEPEYLWHNYKGNWDQIEKSKEFFLEDDNNKNKIIQQLISKKFNTDEIKQAGLKSYLDSIQSLQDYNSAIDSGQEPDDVLTQRVIDDLTNRVRIGQTNDAAAWNDTAINRAIDSLDQKYGDQYSFRDADGRSLIRIASTKDPRQAAYILSWLRNRSTGPDIKNYVNALINNTKDLPPPLTKFVDIDVPSDSDFNELGVPAHAVDRDEMKANAHDKHPTLVAKAQELGYGNNVNLLRKDLGLNYHTRTGEQLQAKIDDATRRGFKGRDQMVAGIKAAIANGAASEYGEANVRNWTFDELRKWEVSKKRWIVIQGDKQSQPMNKDKAEEQAAKWADESTEKIDIVAAPDRQLAEDKHLAHILSLSGLKTPT